MTESAFRCTASAAEIRLSTAVASPVDHGPAQWITAQPGRTTPLSENPLEQHRCIREIGDGEIRAGIAQLVDAVGPSRHAYCAAAVGLGAIDIKRRVANDRHQHRVERPPVVRARAGNGDWGEVAARRAVGAIGAKGKVGGVDPCGLDLDGP